MQEYEIGLASLGDTKGGVGEDDFGDTVGRGDRHSLGIETVFIKVADASHQELCVIRVIAASYYAFSIKCNKVDRTNNPYWSIEVLLRHTIKLRYIIKALLSHIKDILKECFRVLKVI